MTSRKLPRAIIYDWDNTLIDTFPLLFEMTNRTRAKFGLDVWDEATAKRNMRLPAKEVWPEIFGADKWQDAHAFYLAGMKERHLSEMSVLDGAADLVAYVAQKGVTQAVFSNKNCLLLRDEVAQFDTSGHLKVIVGNGDYDGKGKPDPAGLVHTLGALGLESADYSDTWYIGDTENDIQTARSAGVIPVFIENISMVNAKEIAALQPDLSFKSCVECLAYLQSLG